jgi:Fur family transcriptional regulator, ferric uptake regulator
MDKKQLKDLGLKITNPRVKVLSLLETTSSRHMSAESIYQCLKDQGEDIGLATIYRVLGQFEHAGLVNRHNFEEGYSVFELNNGNHHDHLVCVKCKKVVEFCDQVIEQQQKSIAQDFGFKMTDHNLTIYGLCQSCQAD